ncbi:MAG: hypothetical protein HFG64_06880 [Lachnospiraceae bacterium]|nr:hypothetical protein [Lachnospiraceae bacterium]
MKRLIKWLLVCGIICCLLGIGTMTAGAVMGGNHGVDGIRSLLAGGQAWEDQWENRFKASWEQDPLRPRAGAGTEVQLPKEVEVPLEADSSMEGEGPDNGSPLMEEKLYIEGQVPSDMELSIDSELPDEETWLKEGVFPGSPELSTEDGSVYRDIRKLEVDLSGNHVELREWEKLDPGQIWIWCKGNQERTYQIIQKGESLEVKLKGFHYSTRGKAEDLVLYVPATWVFDEVKIENEGGSFQAERIYADKLSLETSAGTTMVYGGSVRALDLECAAGKSGCRAIVSEKASVECDAGTAAIRLAGEEELYDYDLECSLGSIVINDQETKRYQGLDMEKHLDHKTGRKVDLECNAGIIIVDFQEPLT